MVDEGVRSDASKFLEIFARFDSKQSLYIPNQWNREILGNDSKKFTRENIRWNSLNSSRIVPLHKSFRKIREVALGKEYTIEKFITRVNS